MKTFMIVALLFFTFQNSVAQEKADKIIANAIKEAKKENKNVFVIFHASWCSWCKKMEKNMNLPETKPLFSKNFVFAYLDVLETNKTKKLENPGATEFFVKYGANENMGVPFWVILDKNGKMLENSLNDKKENLGCPSEKGEVITFIDKLKKTTSLGNDELSVISKVFTLQK